MAISVQRCLTCSPVTLRLTMCRSKIQMLFYLGALLPTVIYFAIFLTSRNVKAETGIARKNSHSSNINDEDYGQEADTTTRLFDKVQLDITVGNSTRNSHSSNVNDEDYGQGADNTTRLYDKAQLNIPLGNSIQRRESSFSQQDSDIPSLLHIYKKFNLTEHDSLMEFIKEVDNRLKMPWKRNQTNIKKMRRQFKEAGVNMKFYFNKDENRRGEVVPLSTRNVTYHLRGSFYNQLLGQKSRRHPFKGRTPRTCSIVGSSGILLNKHCGSQIDKSDAVFRMNLPKIRPFVKDAGKKSSIVTFVQSIFAKRYQQINSTQAKKKLVNDIKSTIGDAFLVMLMRVGEKEPTIMKKAIHILQQHGVKVLVMNPRHMDAMNLAWWKWGLDTYITSGLWMTSIAIDLCDEVQVYGFWPMIYGPNGKDVPFHYYEYIWRPVRHDLPFEFVLLMELHRLGVIKLNVNACT